MVCSRLAVVISAICWLLNGVAESNGFQPSGYRNSAAVPQGWLSPKVKKRLSFLRGSESSDNDAMEEMGELTSALARIDRQWQIQQRKGGTNDRWTKIKLDRDDDEEEEESSSVKDDPNDIVYMLEPESIIPVSRVICFVGGAGLGQYPHIAYSEFLERVSTKLNAVVFAVPYQVGLDHFTLAKQSGERLGQAIIQCVEKENSQKFRSDYKTYCIAHSLGCKLSTIHMAATGTQYDGVGFLSFNNFGFAKTISMARSFASQLKDGFFGSESASSSKKQSQDDGEDFLQSIFTLAETVVGAIGVEFSPSPSDTERLIELRYDAMNTTRLFVFDDDTLDSSQSFFNVACSIDEQEAQDGGLSVSALPGTHLTPVYFKFSFDELPEEAQGFATQAGVGVRGASFGNEDDLNMLVDEVYDWIMGEEPSKTPSWAEEDTWQGQRRIAGEVETTD